MNAVPVMARPWPARVRVTGTVGPQAAAGPGATESGSPALSPVRVLRWLSVAGGPGAGWSRARGPDRAVSELAARPASRGGSYRDRSTVVLWPHWHSPSLSLSSATWQTNGDRTAGPGPGLRVTSVRATGSHRDCLTQWPAAPRSRCTWSLCDWPQCAPPAGHAAAELPFLDRRAPRRAAAGCQCSSCAADSLLPPGPGKSASAGHPGWVTASGPGPRLAWATASERPPLRPP